MKKLAAILFFIQVATSASAQFLSRYPIIPKPQTLLALSGEFKLDNNVAFFVESRLSIPSVKKETQHFRNTVKKYYGVDILHTKSEGYKSCIYIWLDSAGIPPEGYMMFINENDINIYGSKAGVFYALESLFQLIQPGQTKGEWIIPSCNIIDYPRFSWRGMHLDVARHFFPKENVKQYLRYMAMYKMNTFHWHLTDDQGWRIEIKKYPLLTEVGAWRNATLIGHFSEEPDRYDSTRYGGFYTQDEIKEVVRFADSLHITVVPEIEMPGHVRALLAAYPNVGSGSKQPVASTWGVFNEVLLPSETSFAMMYGILDEVCDLFPSKYIHIGGDECPKDEWKKSEFCQNLIKSYNLKDEHGLQSWFVQHMVTHLEQRGKKAIGWDEILEGGLAEGAAVMSWRGEEGGIAAAKAHHYVVMTPGSHCYFDHYQSKNPGEPLAIGGYLPLDKVYSYDPVPKSLTEAEQKYILGVQANVWTEYIPTFSHVEYMIFPRMAALSEVAWSRKEIKNYDEFLFRAIRHMDFYDNMDVSYSRAIYDINATYSPAPDGNGILLSLNSIAPYGQIRYNYGGMVTLGDSSYSQPVLIKSSREIRASIFFGEEQMGSTFKQSFLSHKAMGKTVTLRKQPAPAYNTGGAFSLVDGITGRTPWTGSEWLGWWGDTMDVVIDLGKIDTVNSIHPITLVDHGSWIHDVNSLSFEISVDGISYRKPSLEELRVISARAENRYKYESTRGLVARYIRVKATALPKIPAGYEGAGYPAWLFVSEIIVE